MPIVHSVTLKNFKGIDQTKIEFLGRTNCPVTTLIGLNESGKTTILEGLSHFVSGDSAISSLFDGVHSRSQTQTLIPVHKKAAFTGDVSIIGLVEPTEEDFQLASQLAADQKLELDKSRFMKKFEVSRNYKFEDSVYTENTNLWSVQIYAKPKRKVATFKECKAPGVGEANLWTNIIHMLQDRFIRIAYFPTFLVDMPARIYLSEHKSESAVNRYYRTVFQDILDSLEGGLSLEKHVARRISEFKAGESNPNWLSIFFGGSSKAPIDSVFQKISSAVTREVLGSWHRVFKRKTPAKLISIEWNVDTQKDDLPYASFVISDGESRYAVSERSLGFRWFFSFLLFTAFKQNAMRPTLFVFDEPAANLHAKAQAELLTSFERIVSKGNHIVYSTHSHHMVNPRWLSGAYIVENTALDYDLEDDTFGLSAKPTNIIATPYRDFVSQHPNRTSYFQPVLEKLEYIAPEIIGSAPFLIVEGITDYYAFQLTRALRHLKLRYSIIPSTGASTSGALLGFLMARGERFTLLLDDDKAGRVAARKYREEWHLTERNVLTLGELNPDLRSGTLERLLSSDTVKLISAHFSCAKEPTKKQIGLYLAEMCASPREGCASRATLDCLAGVLSLMEKHLCVAKA